MDVGSDIENLQAVSQHVLACTAQIAVLEGEKRHVDPASERFRTLSDEIEALAEEIRLVSSAETDLAQDVAGLAGLPTIAEADRQTD